ncbi:TolB protein [Allopseudospirillum japonicum]|uniref:Tol-Pal system protein TolB n=1 Tax=Allopseudospirillum japonicum TaxID=64971 RepID=A0A1H6Q290_9GAMM|nr:Tol-Pal system beta propeller repeat protein TolB [Allopseudospirillum japonicum]SEI37953.1 TolB protein [Allopseudospirillum japonicum]
MLKRLSHGWLLLLCLFSTPLYADLTIEITRGNDQATPIAVVPFRWEGQGAISEDVAEVVSADLQRSAIFAPLARSGLVSTPSQASEVVFRDWRLLKMQYVLVGKITPQAQGYRIQYELFDVLKEERLLGEVITSTDAELRSRAHYISDRVYQKVTGQQGIFSTKIAYITAQRLGEGQYQYRLQIADADGRRARVVLSSKEPILSPDWSPDGRWLAYVSFETGRPAIFAQELATGRRTQLTAFRGLNGSPSWSPDGRRLAMVLSKDGNPELYLLDIASKRLTRLTNHFSIDTEPSWAPDGQSLVFTSNRSGSPQIYRLYLADNRVERITFEGNYNARPRFSANGREIIFVHRASGLHEFHIAAQDVTSKRLRKLTSTTLDESPSIAPNGSMLIYAMQQGEQGVLGVVSIERQLEYRLPAALQDVREPAWSPFLN